MMIRRLTLLCILAVLTPTTSRAAELRIEGAELARMIQTAFNGTVIRLDADTVDKSGKVFPGSFVQLGPTLKSQRFLFSVPAEELSLGFAGGATYEIRDVNSNPAYGLRTATGRKPMGQNIAVTATPATFLIVIRFEDEGTEIVGRPTGRLARMRGGLVPDIQIDKIVLQIALSPLTAPNGTILFRPARVTFFGDIQAQGLADLSIAGHSVDVVDHMTNYKARLKETIEREVSKLINANLPTIASNLQREVMRRGSAIGARVTSIRFEGTNLLIRAEAPLG